jgi:hypothetical protein
VPRNPLTFTDPFGLKDVDYTDAKTKAQVDEMRRKSKTFDNAIHRLEGDHSVLVRIGRGDTSPCGGSGGCTQYAGKNKAGQEEVDVTIHDGSIAADNNLLKDVGGMDALTTLAHEVYGHAHYYLTQGKVCLDGSPGTPANQSCSVRRENVIRREMGYVPRTQY